MADFFQSVVTLTASSRRRDTIEEINDLNLPACSSFEDMGLKDDLLRGILSNHYERPLALQQRIIKPIASGRDAILSTHNSSGRSSALAISMLERIDGGKLECQVLYILPTRELAINLCQFMLNEIAKFMNIKIVSLLGLPSIRDDLNTIREGIHMAVSSLGRISSLIERGLLPMNSVKSVVFDGLDEMNYDSTDGRVLTILNSIPRDAQYIFARSRSESIREDNSFISRVLADRNPLIYRISRSETNRLVFDGVLQYYVGLDTEQYKIDTLIDIYDYCKRSEEGVHLFGVIYTNSDEKSQWVGEKMKEQGYPILILTNEASLEEKKRILDEFHRNRQFILITNVLLTKELEFARLYMRLTVLYDFPVTDGDEDIFLYRAARTSSVMGCKRVVISFVLPSDRAVMRRYEQYFHIEVTELPNGFTL